MKTSELQTIYCQGKQAFEEGIQIKDNPYSEHLNRSLWEHGWEMAFNIQRSISSIKQK